MKTPDEIKRGLKYCTSMVHMLGGCAAMCPYWDETFGCGNDYLMKDALSYIRQLERDNAQKEKHIQQLERERDALMDVVRGSCKHCKHITCSSASEPCQSCYATINDNCHWEWRGVEEEEPT